MFRQTNHDLVGDLIVYRGSLDGFSHYEEMMDGIQKIPEVKAATPAIHAIGLAEIGHYGTDPIQTAVEVEGLDIKKIGDVNGFVRSLHWQKDTLLANADALTREAADDQARATTRAASSAPLDQLEANTMQDDAKDDLATAASLRAKAANFPSWDKPFPDSVYRDQGFKGDVTHWGGIIVGSGVVGLRGTSEWPDHYFRARVKLTVLTAGTDESGPTLGDKTSTNYYWLSDGSHTDVFQVDQGTVYLPFDVLQKQLNMGSSPYTDAVTGEQRTEPARCSEILIRLNDGVDPYQAKPKIEAVVTGVEQQFGLNYNDFGQLKVETWDEHQHDFLNAVEHEESLLVILFAIISIVAIFLIFCIFFMIVMEKTRDIGIIKSVGATSSSIAAIFLGYGLSIGIFGGGMGLLMAYLIVHYINQLHALMAKELGVEIWNAKTYLFDTIPNTMNPRDVVVIVSIAILSSVLGALVPAIRAARMNPVDALRWE